MTTSAFILEAYSHGKAIAALGSSGAQLLAGLGLSANATAGVYTGTAATVTGEVLAALSGPVRFPWRFATDDLGAICA